MDPVVGGGGTSLFEPRFQRRVGVNLTLIQMQLSPPGPVVTFLCFPLGTRWWGRGDKFGCCPTDPVGGQIWLLLRPQDPGPGGGTSFDLDQPFQCSPLSGFFSPRAGKI